MGISNIAWVAGTFVGLIAGGLLADVHWRLVFWINVPFGIFGTVWAYAKLREVGQRTAARIDWWGNITFAAGLIVLLMGITEGIQPYGGHAMGWTNPVVLSAVGGGVALSGLPGERQVSGLRSVVSGRSRGSHRMAWLGSDGHGGTAFPLGSIIGVHISLAWLARGRSCHREHARWLPRS